MRTNGSQRHGSGDTDPPAPPDDDERASARWHLRSSCGRGGRAAVASLLERTVGSVWRRLDRTSPSRHVCRVVTHAAAPAAMWAGIVLLVGVTAAQTDLGDAYCGTSISNGIDLIFGAIAGIGLPATVSMTAWNGIKFTRAGGNPKQKDRAKQGLKYSMTGLLVVVLAVLAPGVVNSMFSGLGVGFSNCVVPFAGP